MYCTGAGGNIVAKNKRNYLFDEDNDKDEYLDEDGTIQRKRLQHPNE